MPEKAVEEGGKLKYGCVIFDDPIRREQGWKATGEEASSRLNMQGTGALPSDTIWLTNMTYQIGSEAGLSGNYRFLISDYLREDILGIAKRHNITDSRLIAELGSKLLSRSMLFSGRLLHAGSDFIPKYSLRKGIHELIGIPDMLMTVDMAKRIEESTVYNTNCEREPGVNREDDVVGVFRVPPRAHCLKILDTLLPFGDFREIPKANLPDSEASREVVQKFLQDYCDMPGFFKVTCRNFTDEFNSLINYGDSASGNSSYKRRWVSTPEAAFLSCMCDMSIHQAFIATSTCRLEKALEIASHVPWQTDLSITAGIFWENFWSGLCVRGSKRRSLQPDQTYMNANTPFLRAKDRIELFDYALAFRNMGFEVLGYATGRIRVNLAGVDPRDVYAAALKTGTIPSFLSLSKDDIPVPKENTDPVAYQQWWYGTDNIQMLLQWDYKIVGKICGLL